MNADQILRLALFQADEIKQSGTASAFITTPEVLAWINDGNRRVEAALREVRSDYFTRVMNSSTDTTPERIFGISYTPSTSLNIASSTSRFTLPPDFKAMESIRCVTSSFETMSFLPRDMSHRDFQDSLKRPAADTTSPGGTVWYDIIGERTLFIVPQLNTSIDIEIVYVARTRPLVRYTTGTIAVTDGTTAVTGTSTVWSSQTPFDANYLDILFGTSGVSALPVPDPTWDYDQVNMAKVSSITNDTALVLAANKTGTLAGGTGYILSSVPQIPPEYRFAIADYTTAKILLKRGGPGAAKAAGFMNAYQTVINDIRAESGIRTESGIDTVEDFDPWVKV